MLSYHAVLAVVLVVRLSLADLSSAGPIGPTDLDPHDGFYPVEVLNLNENGLFSLSQSAIGQNSEMRPPSPIFPTDMSECNRLQASYARFSRQISAEHESCLATHRGPNQSQTSKDSTGRCSVPSCQNLHDKLNDPYWSGSDEVNKCRKTVSEYQAEQQKRKDEREARERRQKEDQEAREDAAKRKAYQDKLDREQSSHEAQARQDAEAEQKWSAKQENKNMQKAAQMVHEHELRTESQEDQERRFNRPQSQSTNSIAHIEWQARKQQRIAQQQQILSRWQRVVNTTQEQPTRDAMLRDVTNQLAKLHAEQIKDPEPK